MIDHNAWLGHWPFRGLGRRGERTFLLETMDRLEIEQAWVSPLDGIFHRVPHRANQWLFAQTKYSPERLKAVPFFHPGLADAIPYLQELKKQDRRPAGIRLMPALYEKETTQMEKALEELSKGDLPILLTRRVVDSRARHPRLPLPEMTKDDMDWWIERLSPATVILAGFTSPEILDIPLSRPQMFPRNVFFETSFIDGLNSIERSREILGSNRLLPGSNAPLFYQEAMITKMATAQDLPSLMAKRHLDCVTAGS